MPDSVLSALLMLTYFSPKKNKTHEEDTSIILYCERHRLRKVEYGTR